MAFEVLNFHVENSPELVSRVTDKFPDLKMVMLTGLSAESLIFSALQSGAIGGFPFGREFGGRDVPRAAVDGDRWHVIPSRQVGRRKRTYQSAAPRIILDRCVTTDGMKRQHA